MPWAPGTTCSTPGCAGVRKQGVCSLCGPKKRTTNPNRPNFRQRGYTAAWDKARLVWLAEHPLCAECERQGITTAAYAVDHIVPHKGDYELFWDYERNWQSLCRSCHNRKAARE